MSSKIRDALLKADVLVSIATFDEDVNIEEVAKIRSEIKSALAEPLKNCEVGTPEEQSVRMAKFCSEQYEKSDGIMLCSGCRFHGIRGLDCQFAWAQMPYDEGENNEQ